MIKKIIKEWVEIVGIATIVTFIWQSVELIIINIRMNASWLKLS